MLIVAPRQYSTSIAAISDSGMVSRLISAARHSYRKDSENHQHQQESEQQRLGEVVDRRVDEVGLTEDGGVEDDVGQAGLAATSITSSTPWVTLSVLPHGSFSTTSSRPGPSLMTASPASGW